MTERPHHPPRLWPRRLPSIPTSNSSRPIARVSRPQQRDSATGRWTTSAGFHAGERKTENPTDSSPRSSNSRVGRPPAGLLRHQNQPIAPSTRTKKNQCFRIHQSGLAGGTSTTVSASPGKRPGNLEKAKGDPRLAGETSELPETVNNLGYDYTASWAKTKCSRVLREGPADAPQLRNRPI